MAPLLRMRHIALAGVVTAVACAKSAPVATPVPAAGPVILTLQELDQDHGKNVLSDRSGIADINSTLEIRIDSTALRQQVSSLVGPSTISPAVITRLAALQAMAVARLDLVRAYTESVERYAADSNAATLQAVQDALKPLAKNARSLYAATKEDKALSDRFEAMLESFFSGAPAATPPSVAQQYDAVLAFAGQEATAARRALDVEAQKAGVRIQVGTWLSTTQGVRPVAAPSLNSTEPSSPFVVDRWSVIMDDAQRKQVEANAQVARAINSDGAAGVVKLLTAAAKASLERISGELRECAKTVNDAVVGITTNAGGNPPTQALNQLKTQVKTLEKVGTDLAALADKYRQPATTADAAAFLQATNADLGTIKAGIETVDATVKQIQATLAGVRTDLLHGGDLDNNAGGLKTKLKGCVPSISEAYDGLSAQFREAFPSARIVALADSAWREVLSFDVGSVPATATVQLITAGPRRAGDVVLIRVAAARGADDKRQVLDEQQVTLQRVLPHLELAVGLVFADPLGSSEVSHRFQAAPAYSVLYRRGSRRSMARNSFWNLGLGLNVAAVDFDKDDVPELGLGLTASTFSDMLNAGVGYNVFIDRAYWFFGVRLPVGILSLAGSRTPVDDSGTQPSQ
jgi:hypothetical protein